MSKIVIWLAQSGGSITSVLMIWVVTGILFYMAVLRVINQDFEIDATAMLVTSGLGVVVNIIMGASLHQHGHSHGGGSGGHAHGGGEEGHAHAEKDTENINVKAAFIHVIGDFLQSLGTLKEFCIFYSKYFVNSQVCSLLLLSSTSNPPGSSLTLSALSFSAFWC
jgi:zinc transporter 2